MLWLALHVGIKLWVTRGFSWVLGAMFAFAPAVGCRSEPAQVQRSRAPDAGAPAARSADDERDTERRTHVPGGVFQAGTPPGTLGRRPELEPRLGPVELGPFEVDRYVHPNDPQRAPLTSASREQAAALCARAQGRLCTELEWERACKGPESKPFATGEAWSRRCEARNDADSPPASQSSSAGGAGAPPESAGPATPASCVNAFGLRGMGSFAEWTASSDQDAHGERRAVVRARTRGEPFEHRCAHRWLAAPTVSEQGIAFRCCYGAPNAAVLSEREIGPAFRKTALGQAALEQLLSSQPLTAELARELTLFREPVAAASVVARGPSERKGFDFTVAPLLWSPVRGAEFLALSARSGKDTSFVLVYHVLGPDSYALASSFIMKGEPGPIAFAYSNDIRPRFHFSSCWGCPGETGKILYRAPDHAIILQP